MSVNVCINFFDYFRIDREQLQYAGNNINISLKMQFTHYAILSLIYAYFLQNEIVI